MVPGLANRILRVDLSRREVSVEEPDEGFYRKYLGGACFVSYYLLKEVKRGAEALSPENVLVFATGPVTGVGLPGGRNCVGAKSPLSEGFGKSEVGGFWGWELKRAGFDAIIVKGRAERPVYLWVHDGEVEIRDAGHLWGKTVLETHDALAGELGERMVRTAIIGPGGENLVRFACVINDLRNAAGRCGMGAVMGSKNLKAIAVRGRQAPKVADPDKIREMARWMSQNFMSLGAASLHEVGTGGGDSMVAGNNVGNLPVRNWGDGHFEGVEKITADAIRDTVRVGMEGCAGCPIRCKKLVEFEEPYRVNRRNGGPEYETLAALGSFCGVDDLKAICRANELCSLHSLDSISTGGVIAFAMECFENEILTPRDTGGIELRFGNAEAMLQAIEMIVRREGIGDVLAEGTRRAAQKIGRGTEEFAMHVKGVEMGMHEPRLKQGMGIIMSVEAHGADHNVGIHDTMFFQEGPAIRALRSLGPFDPLPLSDLSPAKVAMAKAYHLRRLLNDCLVCCASVPWTISQQAEMVKVVTGWDFTVMEAMQAAERVVTMGRAFNLREGITAAEDQLPKRFFSPTPRGALKNTPIDPQAMKAAIRTFYAMMGWDRDTGVPTVERLHELGIGWVADEIASAQTSRG